MPKAKALCIWESYQISGWMHVWMLLNWWHYRMALSFVCAHSVRSLLDIWPTSVVPYEFRRLLCYLCCLDPGYIVTNMYPLIHTINHIGCRLVVNYVEWWTYVKWNVRLWIHWVKTAGCGLTLMWHCILSVQFHTLDSLSLLTLLVAWDLLTDLFTVQQPHGCCCWSWAWEVAFQVKLLRCAEKLKIAAAVGSETR